MTKKFMFRKVQVTERRLGKEYSCEGQTESTLIDLLNLLGKDGWDYAGEGEGIPIVKKEYE